MSSHQESSINTNGINEAGDAQRHLIMALNTFVQRCLRRSHQRRCGLATVAPYAPTNPAHETLCHTKETQIATVSAETALDR
jgi:hypothetical protein